MKYENFTDTIEADALTSAAWDNARRTAEIERAAVISSFFKWVFERSKAEHSTPVVHGRLPERIATPVIVGGHD